PSGQATSPVPVLEAAALEPSALFVPASPVEVSCSPEPLPSSAWRMPGPQPPRTASNARARRGSLVEDAATPRTPGAGCRVPGAGCHSIMVHPQRLDSLQESTIAVISTVSSDSAHRCEGGTG